jgi:hypothetical protein
VIKLPNTHQVRPAGRWPPSRQGTVAAAHRAEAHCESMLALPSGQEATPCSCVGVSSPPGAWRSSDAHLIVERWINDTASSS